MVSKCSSYIVLFLSTVVTLSRCQETPFPSQSQSHPGNRHIPWRANPKTQRNAKQGKHPKDKATTQAAKQIALLADRTPHPHLLLQCKPPKMLSLVIIKNFESINAEGFPHLPAPGSRIMISLFFRSLGQQQNQNIQKGGFFPSQ